MTESSPAVFVSRNSSFADYLTVGPPISNTKAKVVDPTDDTVEYGPGEIGEIMINGPQVCGNNNRKQRLNKQLPMDLINIGIFYKKKIIGLCVYIL